MLYAVYCRDANVVPGLRQHHYPAHRQHLQSMPGEMRLVMAGPLMSQLPDEFAGSLLVIDSESEDSVRKFVAADPFTQQNVWIEQLIHPFLPIASSPAPESSSTSTKGQS